MKTTKTPGAGVLLAMAVAGLFAQSVLAQSFPARPLRMVVPFPPGGGADVSGRALSGRMSEGLGQPVVVENRPGASGRIGARAVLQSPADGYTLLLTSAGAVIVAPHLEKLDFDPIKDFAPVAPVGTANLAIAVRGSGPIRSLADLVKLSQQTQGGIFYSVSSLGTMPHLAAELFGTVSKTDWKPVSYKGAGPAAAAVIGGEVPATLVDLTTLVPHHAGGRLRILAVTSVKRSPAVPDVPTVAESGFPGYSADAWVGLFVPAATPADIVNRLNAEVARAMATPEVSKALMQTGTDPVSSSAEQFRRKIAEEYDKWGKVIRSANIKLEP